jgi:TRAP-type C4-dicarboxylate transport system permease small subunit
VIALAAALDRVAGVLARCGSAVAALVLAFMMTHILVEIVLRNVFSSSTYVVDEFTGYGLGAATVLALADTLRRGEMIRVHVLLARLRDGARRVVEIVCALLTLAAVLLVTAFFATGTLRSYREGSVSTSLLEVPLWVPELIFVIGFLLLALQLVAYGARLLVDPGATIAVKDVTSE